MKESKKRKARLSAQDRIASLSAGNAAHVHKALRVLADTAHCPELLLKDLKREGLAAGAPMLCSLTAKGYRLLASLDQPITAEGPKKAQAAIRLPDVLDRLAHPRKGEARLLEAPELAAARRFQTDLARAGLQQRVTQNWSLTSIMHSGRSAGTPSPAIGCARLAACSVQTSLRCLLISV